MKILNFDLEATGLPVYSRMTVAGWRFNGSCTSIETTHSVTRLCRLLVKAAQTGHYVVGHNIWCYDLPLLVYNERRESNSTSLLNALHKYKERFIDTLILSRKYFIKHQGHSMEAWVPRLRYEGYDIQTKTEVEDWSESNMDVLKERVTGDVVIQEAITQYFMEHHKLHKLIPNIENVAKTQSFITALMSNGVPYNEALAEEKARVLSNKMEFQLYRMREVFGDINPNSNMQISNQLYEVEGEHLPLGKPSEKTNKRRPQFNQDNRTYLTNKFPCLRPIVKYKELKGQHDYVKRDHESAKSFLNSSAHSALFRGACIHPSLSLFSARTQRSQFKSPPLNQLSKKVRQFIEAPEGFIMLGVDIKALELMTLGTVLEDVFGISDIMDAIREGKDPKKHTISELQAAFNEVERLDPSKDLNDLAKRVNYAYLFGQSPKNVCHATLGIDMTYAGGVERGLANRFPGTDIFLKALQSQIKESGFLVNLYGLRVLSPGYCAINSFIQSSGTEYSLMILSLFYRELLREYGEVHPIIYNHDEAQFLIPWECDEALDWLRSTVEEILTAMPQRFEDEYNVQFITGLDYKLGFNWADTH